MTDTFTPIFIKNCHKGNTLLYTEPNGGSLYIGGWTNEARVTQNMHVIDLTGMEHKFYGIASAMDSVSQEFLQYTNTCAGWLSLPFPDYGTPHNLTTLEQWQGVANVIRKILQNGNDVLVACGGGHGRSGLFCSIVGYILGLSTNPEWANPVDYIRKIHCDQSVETFAQEKFVFNILGLEMPIQTSYSTWGTLSICPLCGAESIFAQPYGMCKSCSEKWEKHAPIKDDLTLDDIDHPIEHLCGDKKCMGIYKARACGHVVHNRIVYDGLCEQCYNEDVHDQICVNCGKDSAYAAKAGICYDCTNQLANSKQVDFVHNTLTDGYRAVPHTCNATLCNGIVIADICSHVVHNHNVVDGLCEHCQEVK